MWKCIKKASFVAQQAQNSLKMVQIGPKRAPNLSGTVSKIGYKGKEKLKVSIEM